MPEQTRILVVEDEANLRRVLSTILARDGYEVIEAVDGEQALGLIGQGVAAVITDLRMPRLDGMGLLRRVVAEQPSLPVILITAHGSVDSAVNAVKLGAFDYIEKPFEQDHIRQVVAKAIRTHELDRRSPRRELAATLSPHRADGGFGLVGSSDALSPILQVIELIRRLCRDNNSVLVACHDREIIELPGIRRLHLAGGRLIAAP